MNLDLSLTRPATARPTENGYLYPIRVFSDAETAEFRRQFDDYTAQNKNLLGKMIPRERRAVYGLT